jgi:hypothetical protein
VGGAPSPWRGTLAGMAETVVRVQRGAALGVLARRVDALEAAGDVSASRARQLRMVVGMWRLALEQWPAGAPVPERGAGGLFDDRVLEAFWELAVAGRLRTRGSGAVRPLSVPTRRVVRDCLGLLADQVVPGRAVWLPVVEQQVPKPMVPRGSLPCCTGGWRTWRRMPRWRAGRVTLSEQDRVRLLAMIVGRAGHRCPLGGAGDDAAV